MRVVEPGAAGIAVCEREDGQRSEVLCDLVWPVAAGDSLLVHAGTALLRLEPAA